MTERPVDPAAQVIADARGEAAADNLVTAEKRGRLRHVIQGSEPEIDW